MLKFIGFENVVTKVLKIKLLCDFNKTFNF